MDRQRVDAAELVGASVLVTGGAGFIGSHLVERLVADGAEVTVLDDLSAGRERNLDAVAGEVRFVEGDVRDPGVVDDVVHGRDRVFHLAANAHVPTSLEEPRYDFDVNARGTQVVLEACVDAGVERVVLASSAAVYGPPESVPMAETHPVDPVSPYGASKLAGEKLGFAYGGSFDLDVSALRIFNTYGSRQPRYVMYDFLRKLEADPSRLEVLGSGEEVRTFAYVSDTVDAFVALGVAEEAAGRAYNFGGGEPTRIGDLAELMAERYAPGETEVVTTGVAKPGDIARLVSENARIGELGVAPTVSLEEGLDRMWEWFETAKREATH